MRCATGAQGARDMGRMRGGWNSAEGIGGWGVRGKRGAMAGPAMQCRPWEWPGCATRARRAPLHPWAARGGLDPFRDGTLSDL
jgi:hypothetical protein